MTSIEYQYNDDGITADMIDGFFVGWPTTPSPDQLIRVMAGSYRRVWALADGRVVGYINAISDGVLNAFIPWLEVHPDYQNHGIGTELVTRLVDQLDGMYAIDLLCDADVQGWYADRGFITSNGACLRQPAAIQSATIQSTTTPPSQ